MDGGRAGGGVQRLLSALLVGLLAGSATGIAGQQACSDSLQLRGIVRTATGAGLPEASVSIPAIQRRVVAGPGGRFSVSAVCPGEYRMLASFLGYGTSDRVHELRSDTLLDIRLTLEAIELEGVRVEVQPIMRALEYRRRSYGGRSALFDWRDFTAATLPESIPRWVVRRAGVMLVRCGDAYWGVDNCFTDRRGIQPVEVCVNETVSVSGATEIARLPREEIGRAEFFRREGLMKIYTKEFLARAAMAPWMVRATATSC